MFNRIGTAGLTLTAVLLVSGLGAALAQRGEGDATVDVIKVDPVGETPGEGAVSPSDQKKAAQAAVEAASANCGAQGRALQSAKRSKDIIRATCLDDKLSQCTANLQNMKRRQAALEEAIGEGDRGRANHESTVIGVLSQKFKMLAQAANQCVGQDLFDTGDTETTGEADLFAPDQNPGVVPPIPDWPIPYIPPPVSGVS